MHNVNDWSQFFDTESFNLFDRSIILKELISQIRNSVRPQASLIEVGCGSGIASILLASMGFKITAIDKNADLIDALQGLTGVFPDFSPQEMDMFQTDFPDRSFSLAFSQGVLEHYSHHEIVDALVEQRRIAEVVVIDVPNGRGKIGDYGDERCISPTHWKYLIKSAGLTVVHESARGMARWSQVNQTLLGWLEDSVISRRYGENSIFIAQ